MNPAVHFEIPAKHRKRMADFYTQVFGWRTQMLGPEMGNYVVVTTTELDTNGRPKSPGTINGGFFQKSNDKPDQYPSIVIAVDDIKQHMTKLKKLAASCLANQWTYPEWGHMCPFVTRKATEWQCCSRCLLCRCALISNRLGKPVEHINLKMVKSRAEYPAETTRGHGC